MSDNKYTDIMGLLLSEEVGDDIDELQQLNDIIFCSSEKLPMEVGNTEEGELIWQTEEDQFALHLWKIEGRISLKLIPKSKSNYSVERLAKVAIAAVLEDLKKADS
ncbi:hypothetical protein [Amphritea balenae]|uniref:Uncharacterized protein n=1 Tax=Amphritea balenae TaxID=452629 RepID=A0A3P1SX59_9GAMM|nr:hypothetical protein [Amphritea balenae]RRD01704.1 hypothetical protein EHS89_03885 [Amphritea balenae]GGK54871.1 hypothetical protein GCM10007941_01090 [Amphritea balenae]